MKATAGVVVEKRSITTIAQPKSDIIPSIAASKEEEGWSRGKAQTWLYTGAKGRTGGLLKTDKKEMARASAQTRLYTGAKGRTGGLIETEKEEVEDRCVR